MAGPPPGRMPFPLNTPSTNNTNNGHTGISSASPGNSAPDMSRLPSDRSRYPPTSAGAKESLGRKRLAGPPINVNVDKRPRTNVSSEQSRPNAVGSPAASRQNSMTGTVGPSPARRSSAAMSPADNIVHSSRDPRKQVRGPAGSASPMNVASPLSTVNGDASQYDSRNASPVRGAPTAPSMVPQKAPVVNGATRGVASIRQAAGKKQMLAAVAPENSALARIRVTYIELQNDLKNEKTRLNSETAQRSKLQTELDNEKKMRSELEDRLQRLEEKVEKSHQAPADPTVSEHLSELSRKLCNLEASQQDPLTNETSIRTLVDRLLPLVRPEVESIIEQVEKSIKQSLDSDIAGLRSQVTGLGNDTQSYKARVDGIAKDQKTELNANKAHIDKISKQISDLKSDFVTQKQNTTEQLKSIRTELSQTLQVAHPELVKNMNQCAQTIRTDIMKEVDAIRQVVGENKKHAQTTSGEMKSSTFTLVETLRNEITASKSAVLADMQKLRSDFTELDSSTDDSLKNMQLDLSEFKSAALSDKGRIQSQIEKLQSTSSARRSPATPSARAVLPQDVTEELNQLRTEFRNQVEELTGDVRDALGAADRAETLTNDLMNLGTRIDEIYNPKFDTIHKDINALQDNIKTTREQSSAGNESINALRSDINGLQHALKSLEDRYQNMTTEELHQRMVHWFTQAYPNAHNFLNKMLLLEKDIASIGGFANSIAWMSDRGRDSQLMGLADKCDAIHRLLNDQQKLGHPHTWEDFATIRQDIRDVAETRTQELEALRVHLGNDRKQLTDGVKSVADGLANSLVGLRTDVNNVRTSIEKLELYMNQSESAIQNLNSSNPELRTRMETAESTLLEHGQTLERQQQVISRVQKEYSRAVRAVDEHQNAILAINNNPRGGLKLNFSQSFSKPAE